jgi:membrane protease YdiL (CAAX protease family)
MKWVRKLLENQPFLSVLMVIVLVAVVMFSTFLLFVKQLGMYPLVPAAALATTALLLLWVLVRSGSATEAGVSLPLSAWGRRWWVPTAVMAVIALSTLTPSQVDFGHLAFTVSHTIDWLGNFLATGLQEEVWFRGVCFYILYRAWGSTRAGVYKAAAVQALLFGVLHMANLHRADLVHVIYQSCYATFIGFGFAGLVVYSRSIWPAVFLHCLFNAVGSLGNYFAGPGSNTSELTFTTMLTVVGMFFLFGALPGAWCLKRAPLH